MATISSAAIETMVPRRCTSVTNRNRRATALLQCPEQERYRSVVGPVDGADGAAISPERRSLLTRYFLIASCIFEEEDRRGEDRALHVDVPGRIRRRTRGRPGA